MGSRIKGKYCVLAVPVEYITGLWEQTSTLIIPTAPPRFHSHLLCKPSYCHKGQVGAESVPLQKDQRQVVKMGILFFLMRERGGGEYQGFVR